MAISDNSPLMCRNVQRDEKERKGKERERERESREQRDGYNKLRGEEEITNG